MSFTPSPKLLSNFGRKRGRLETKENEFDKCSPSDDALIDMMDDIEGKLKGIKKEFLLTSTDTLPTLPHCTISRKITPKGLSTLKGTSTVHNKKLRVLGRDVKDETNYETTFLKMKQIIAPLKYSESKVIHKNFKIERVQEKERASAILRLYEVEQINLNLQEDIDTFRLDNENLKMSLKEEKVKRTESEYQTNALKLEIEQLKTKFEAKHSEMSVLYKSKLSRAEDNLEGVKIKLETEIKQRQIEAAESKSSRKELETEKKRLMISVTEMAKYKSSSEELKTKLNEERQKQTEIDELSINNARKLSQYKSTIKDLTTKLVSAKEQHNLKRAIFESKINDLTIKLESKKKEKDSETNALLLKTKNVEHMQDLHAERLKRISTENQLKNLQKLVGNIENKCRHLQVSYNHEKTKRKLAQKEVKELKEQIHSMEMNKKVEIQEFEPIEERSCSNECYEFSESFTQLVDHDSNKEQRDVEKEQKHLKSKITEQRQNLESFVKKSAWETMGKFPPPNIEKQSLCDAINYLKAESNGKISLRFLDVLHTIRKHGNTGSHCNKDKKLAREELTPVMKEYKRLKKKFVKSCAN